MAYLDSKYHVKIDTVGYTLAPSRGGRKAYQKKTAPFFVGKFGSGDSSYRDATAWQFWVQTNWRNGSHQLKWDDPGKFWKSSNVDTTEPEALTLSRALVSAGQVEAGAKINCIGSWRSAQNWWNASYGYRKQLTITAPSTSQLPSGYPIIVSEDTAALQTASKLLANRNDWRIVYWNGSTLIDLTRDYVSTTRTVFALQAAIKSSASDTNY